MKMPIDLIAACQMFLIPSTILFGALGVAASEGLKTLISIMGAATSVVWLMCIWNWGDMPNVDRSSVLILAGIFVFAWVGSFVTHFYYGCTSGWKKPAEDTALKNNKASSLPSQP